MQQLTLILFRIAGFLMGVHVDEVWQGLRSEPAAKIEQNMERIDLRKLWGLPQSGTDGGAQFLMIRAGTRRLLADVDSIEGLVTVTRTEVRPLPPLIAAQEIGKWIWGIALMQDKMAYLVHFDVLRGEYVKQGPGAVDAAKVRRNADDSNEISMRGSNKHD